MMDVSIITPSYNMLPYLKCAAASVADQYAGEARVEHLVMDGASDDGTTEWLAGNPGIHGISERDNGMYDAVNKGLKRANGKILAYLNCDEQYLPGTLEFVTDYFERNPQVDMIFGDLLLIRPDGSLIAYRKGYQPRWFYIVTSHLYVLSCTMFFRREIVDDGFFFDTRFRTTGDADFVVRVLRQGYRVRHLRRYMAAFTMTGKNLSGDDVGLREQHELLTSAPMFLKKTRWLLNGTRLLEKLFSGAYFQKKPFEYSVYVQNREGRITFCVDNPSFRWRFE